MLRNPHFPVPVFKFPVLAKHPVDVTDLDPRKLTYIITARRMISGAGIEIKKWAAFAHPATLIADPARFNQVPSDRASTGSWVLG
jgi:hypothetical protein